MASADPIIVLNVGGTAFSTRLSTLTSHREPDSVFHAMFDRDAGWKPAEKDDQGRYFFDRCPDMFKIVLEWLRTGELAVPEATGSNSRSLVKRISAEAQYFGLTELDAHVKATLSRRIETFICVERVDESDFPGDFVWRLTCPFDGTTIPGLEELHAVLDSGVFDSRRLPVDATTARFDGAKPNHYLTILREIEEGYALVGAGRISRGGKSAVRSFFRKVTEL
ncbi:POZ domain-containing protein [Gonapodya prolifera JEL478]|uniref:POZ domain-containing protein n=1 Tax=Gonapodya prolifera (strain JEL478) TaxID=1344416 RepID=A0A139AH19_GONPJ|nr:POZ domain-containing protein [Gonapodya prolifera JEL478]|eukprot:KXS15854.1 POZ domain-containing protein [Gonapodya prolifera JEL478]